MSRLEEILCREGESFTESYTMPGSDLSGASFPDSIGNLPFPALGKAYFISEIRFTANKNCALRLIMGEPNVLGAGQVPVVSYGGKVKAGETLIVPTPGLVIRGSVTDYSKTVMYVDGIDDSDKTGCALGFEAVGRKIVDDLQFDAKWKNLFFHDSILAGSGPISMDWFLVWRMMHYLRSRGESSRAVSRGDGGAEMRGLGILASRAGSEFDPSGVARLWFMAGVNDVGHGVSLTDSMASFNAWLLWAQETYPKAEKIILGTLPISDSTLEALLVTLRAAQVSAISALDDPTFKYFSLAGAFDRTNAANYSETSGIMVHPSDIGCAAIWNGGYSGFIGLKAWMAANVGIRP